MTTLAQYDRARTALAEAATIDQVLPILDEIEHIQLYARQIADRELLADAVAFQMQVERRLGLVIAAAKEAGHFRQGKRSKKSEPELSRATLEEVGVDRKLSARSQRAASISERAYEAMMARRRDSILAGGAIVVDQIAAELREVEDVKRKADHAERTLTGGKVEDLHALAASGYRAGAILADPPWHFMARSDKGDGRSAASHYTTDRRWRDIIELPVAQLAAPDATLFMWMVDWCPKLALEVIEAWGFAHKTTAFTWVKLTEGHDGKPRADIIAEGDFHFGMGYWTRANPEDCWLATRGSPKRIHADVRQLLVHPVMEHSRKPDEVHDRVQRLVGGPYLELYARREREGWQTWGNEIPPPKPPHDPETGEVIETQSNSPAPANETRGGTGDDCSVGKRGAWPPEGVDGDPHGLNVEPEPDVTAGETDSDTCERAAAESGVTAGETAPNSAFPLTELADLRKLANDELLPLDRLAQYEARGLITSALGPWRLTGAGQVRLAVVERERSDRVAFYKAHLDQEQFADWWDLSSIEGGEHLDAATVRSLVGLDFASCTDDEVYLTEAGRARLRELDEMPTERVPPPAADRPALQSTAGEVSQQVDVSSETADPAVPSAERPGPSLPIDLPLFLPAKEATA